MIKAGSEQQLHIDVVDYLRVQYRGVIFRTDFAAGVKMPAWMAARHKRMQYKSGFPDIFIFQPVQHNGTYYAGFGLELKALGVRVKKLDGSWANEHIENQASMLTELKKASYFACFAVGFDQAKAAIDWYFSGEPVIDFDGLLIKGWESKEQADLGDDIF